MIHTASLPVSGLDTRWLELLSHSLSATVSRTISLLLEMTGEANLRLCVSTANQPHEYIQVTSRVTTRDHHQERMPVDTPPRKGSRTSLDETDSSALRRPATRAKGTDCACRRQLLQSTAGRSRLDACKHKLGTTSWEAQLPLYAYAIT